VVGSFAAVVVGALVLRHVPFLAIALAGPTVGSPSHNAAIAQTSVAVVWLALGAAYTARGVRRERALFTWLGLMLLGFAEARLVLSLNVGHAVSLTLSYGIRSLALVFGLYGAARELQHGFVEQRAQLIKSLLDLETAETRLRAEQAAGEERAHDLRSALLAVGGAAHTFECYYESLDGPTRESLARALSTEISRIQKLITPVHLEEVTFDVAEMLEPLVTCRAAAGDDITLSVPRGLLAVGRPAHTAEVVMNLLDNARRYAAGSPIRVRAERERRSVVIRVEDRGSGVPVSEQRLVFERGWRGAASSGVEGSGLGLYVAARLMEDQGGSLWVENRRGGGASFALRLPLGHPEPAPSVEASGAVRDRLALEGT
jgi:signal transduction histidine kinase